MPAVFSASVYLVKDVRAEKTFDLQIYTENRKKNANRTFGTESAVRKMTRRTNRRCERTINPLEGWDEQAAIPTDRPSFARLPCLPYLPYLS